MADTKVEGVIIFKPHEKAPDFVKGTLVISLNKLIAWAKANPSALSEYQGDKQIRMQLKDGSHGLYAALDTYKKESKPVAEDKDSLPF